MKKSKKSIIAIMVIAMLFTTLAPLAVSASDPTPTPTDKVYYFYDYYPTLDEETLRDEFGEDLAVTYDYARGMIGFFDLISTVFPDPLECKCVVIIDIKTYMPNPFDLYNLFFYLKETMGCQTIFVTYYSANDFDYLLDYVDVFIPNAGFEQLEFFVNGAINHLEGLYNGAENQEADVESLCDTSYLIDARMVHIPENYTANDLDELCSRSVFLRLFLDRLILDLGIAFNGSNQDCAEYIAYYNIRVLVYLEKNVFVDVFTGYMYAYETVDEIFPENEEDGCPSTQCICAFGFWRLTQDFYDFLWNAQKAIPAHDFPIYIFPADHINYDPTGLDIITSESFSNGYEDAAKASLLQGLHSLLN